MVYSVFFLETGWLTYCSLLLIWFQFRSENLRFSSRAGDGLFRRSLLPVPLVLLPLDDFVLMVMV